MLNDQFSPHLPKDNEEVNAYMKHLQVMLDATTVVDPALDCDDEALGHEFDHRQSPHWDSASSSLHRRNAVEGKTRMTETCVTSFAAKMHVAGSKTSIRSMSALNRNDVKRGTMTIMVPIMTNLTDSTLLKEGAM
jgi:hypothetical protein